MLFSFSFLQVTLVKMVNEATANIPNWDTQWTFAQILEKKEIFCFLSSLLEWFIYTNLRLYVFMSKRYNNLNRK